MNKQPSKRWRRLRRKVWKVLLALERWGERNDLFKNVFHIVGIILLYIFFRDCF